MIIFGVEQYIDRAYKAGQGNERAKIVEWLREPGWERTFELEAIIKDIEAGEHLK